MERDGHPTVAQGAPHRVVVRVVVVRQRGVDVCLDLAGERHRAQSVVVGVGNLLDHLLHRAHEVHGGRGGEPLRRRREVVLTPSVERQRLRVHELRVDRLAERPDERRDELGGHSVVVDRLEPLLDGPRAQVLLERRLEVAVVEALHVGQLEQRHAVLALDGRDREALHHVVEEAHAFGKGLPRDLDALVEALVVHALEVRLEVDQALGVAVHRDDDVSGFAGELLGHDAPPRRAADCWNSRII